MPADIIGFGYALTVAAGGIIGYLKAGTIPMTCCHAFLFTFLGYLAGESEGVGTGVRYL